jgi:hypothetical protein
VPFSRLTIALIVLLWALQGGYIRERKTSLSRPAAIPAKAGIRMRGARYGRNWPQVQVYRLKIECGAEESSIAAVFQKEPTMLAMATVAWVIIGLVVLVVAVVIGIKIKDRYY